MQRKDKGLDILVAGPATLLTAAVPRPVWFIDRTDEVEINARRGIGIIAKNASEYRPYTSRIVPHTHP